MGLDVWQWLALAERELLLFAGVFFLLGAVDELFVDAAWLWLRATRRARTHVFSPGTPHSARRAAVLVPAWQERAVLAATLRHMLAAWHGAPVRIWVGTYANDPATGAIAAAAAQANPAVRHYVLEHHGPTTKADCLNHLYHALAMDERQSAERAD